MAAVLIDAGRSLLLVVDVQEHLAAAVAGAEACIERCRLLIEAARRLDVPVFASEQYPKGLGPTVAALRSLIPPENIIDKICFAGADDGRLAAALRACGREQTVLAGMEAHVCVLQTALSLKRDGFAPAVAADAIASRDPVNRDLALHRLRACGVDVVSSEMVVFEWLGRAGTPAFKAVLPLIR